MVQLPTLSRREFVAALALAPTISLSQSAAGARLAYDTSFGLGTDLDGLATLPLHPSAKRIYVGPGGNIGNSGRSWSQRLPDTDAGLRAGLALVGSGAGDQVLVAWNCAPFGIGIGDVMQKYGHSPRYPTVWQSCDPADPENEAKHGRAGPLGQRPKIFKSRTGTLMRNSAGDSEAIRRCMAVRGFDFDADPSIDASLGGDGLGATCNFNTNSYLLFENNIFRGASISGGSASGVASNWVIRGNSFYGNWISSGNSQPIYITGVNGITVEDNVFYHVGWRPGATRATAVLKGGPDVRSHCIYTIEDTRDVLARRNMFIDPAATGGSIRGDVEYYHNLHVDCPFPTAFGPGDEAAKLAPGGCLRRVYENFVLGNSPVSAMNPQTGGFNGGNYAPGSYIRRNILARSLTGELPVVMNRNNFAGRSVLEFSDNRVYLYGKEFLREVSGGASLAQVATNYGTIHGNGPAKGTDRPAIAPYTPRNAYTARQLWSHLGFASKAEFALHMVEHPELVTERLTTAMLWLFAGYNGTIDITSR
jgi:hypothetical protein